MSRKKIICLITLLASGLGALLFGIANPHTKANQTPSGGKIIGTIVERDTNVPIKVLIPDPSVV